MEIPAGADLRSVKYRREVWQRFYSFHLRYRTHPGCVYFTLPHMAAQLNWDAEQRYWAAWLNANTQNPVTTLLLMQAGSHPREHEKVTAYWQRNFTALQWDTDRRHHKAWLGRACARYWDIVSSKPCNGSQQRYWRAAAKNWDVAWQLMQALPTMGRLSGWSGLEYVRLLGDVQIPDADTLLLNDDQGSRSHRNGLALLAGYPEHVQDAQLNAAAHAEPWPPGFLQEMETFATELLSEAQARNPGNPDVGYLTLESALCTWKSWHKRNRRYPNVYADMLHERIRWAEARHGHQFGVLWDARREALPAHLRLETTPEDPGCVPIKQNYYRSTGQQVLLGYDWPELWSAFDQAVKDGKWGKFR